MLWMQKSSLPRESGVVPLANYLAVVCHLNTHVLVLGTQELGKMAVVAIADVRASRQSFQNMLLIAVRTRDGKQRVRIAW